jgi:hypothetical protein
MISALILFLFLLSSVVAGTSEEGLKWLAQKKLEDGVVSLPSGLMYKEELPGTGTSTRNVLVSVRVQWLFDLYSSHILPFRYRKVSHDRQSLQMPLQRYLD